MIRHLPAIILRDDFDDWWTMAAACGKRGPIATRDAAEGGQAELLSLDAVCPECSVTWDAEERGGLRRVWLRQARVAWAGSGAVLLAKEPEPRKCPHCSKPTGGGLFVRTVATCFAVVVRDQRSKVRAA